MVNISQATISNYFKDNKEIVDLVKNVQAIEESDPSLFDWLATYEFSEGTGFANTKLPEITQLQKLCVLYKDSGSSFCCRMRQLQYICCEEHNKSVGVEDVTMHLLSTTN